MSKLVQLSEILDGADNQLKKGNFIQVSTLWTSGKFVTKGGIRLYKYIFVDSHGRHISGVLFGHNHNTNNIHQKLKKQDIWLRIKNFRVTNVPENDWCDIRKQTRQIKLSKSSADVENLQLEVPMSKHLPFEFTELEDVDSCEIDKIIDVIGYATNVSDISSAVNHSAYRNVTMSSSVSNENDDQFLRKITLFDDYAKQITERNQVYAMLNIRVGEHGIDEEKNRTLKTTSRTIICQIKQDELFKLPAKYRTATNILNLFPKPLQISTSPNNFTFYADVNLTSGSDFGNGVTPGSSQESPIEQYSPGHPGYYSTSQLASYHTMSTATTLPLGKSNSYNIQIETEPIFNRKRPSDNTESENHAQKRNCKQKSVSPTENCFDKYYDFIENKKQLEVFVKPAKQFMDTDNKSYPMRSNPRGIALIINNNYFPKRDDKLRVGSSKDVEYLHELFKQMRFDVTIKQDVDSETLPEILEKFKQKATPEMDACFVAISSHGTNGLVEMQDSALVPLPNNIIHQFDKEAFPVMAGKPKVFLVQTCQNIPSEYNLRKLTRVTNQRENVDLQNMLVCYAATPGLPAERDKFLGSAFVYVFTDTVMEYAYKYDLLKMLTIVQKRLKQVKRMETNVLNCYWTGYEFDKKFFFNPGM